LAQRLLRILYLDVQNRGGRKRNLDSGRRLPRNERDPSGGSIPLARVQVLIARRLHANQVIAGCESLNLEGAIGARFRVPGERWGPSAAGDHQCSRNRLQRLGVENRTADAGRSSRFGLRQRSMDRKQ
jgi:hypothetical protein